MNKETKQDISLFSREELVKRVQQLQEQNNQLKKKLSKEENDETETKSKKKRNEKPFNFSKHPQRHIVLKFLYLGWNRQGFAMQDDADNTIETALIKALLTTKLIESRSSANYHRCGRTDRGVSAFSQVVSLTVRSAIKDSKGESKNTQDCTDKLKNEMNYPKILNRVLPRDIRILAWSPVSPKFSARFDCTSRTYKYFFPRSNLNLKAMNEGAQYLIGKHDYRNFCKMNVAGGVVNFKRRICRFTVEEVNYAPASEQDLCGTEEDTYSPSSPFKALKTSSSDNLGKVDLQESQIESQSQDFQNGALSHVLEVENFLKENLNVTPLRRFCDETDKTLLQNSCNQTEKTPSQNSFDQSEKTHSLNSCNHTEKTPSQNSFDQTEKTPSLNSCDLTKKTAHNSCDQTEKAPSQKSCDQTAKTPQNSSEQTEKTPSQTPNKAPLSSEITNHDDSSSWVHGYRICVATIEGTAFLWHQIRAIMTVLILIGQGKEDPLVVKKLLDVDEIKKRPQYGFASGVGLNLYDAGYRNIDWQYDEENLSIVISQLQVTWSDFAIKASMIQNMLGDLSSYANENFPTRVLPSDQIALCLHDPRPCLLEQQRKGYRPLLERLTGESLEDRVRHYVEKKRLDPSFLKQFEMESDDTS